MKKLTSFLLLITLVVSCKKNTLNEVVKGEIFAINEQNDSNGFTYETVNNDPTGLRVYTLENGLKRIEAGAQGEHKLSRGYLPSFVYSLHWFLDENFEKAVGDYLQKEGEVVSNNRDIMLKESPFK